MNPARTGIFRLAADLCRLRAGPQDLPYSPRLLVLLLVSALALDGVTGALLGDAEDALAHSLLGIAVVFGLTWFTLQLRGHPARFVQSASALAGAGIAISLAQLPVALLIELPTDAAALAALAHDPLQVALRWLLLATLAWQVLVNAHILQHAAGIRRGFAVVLVISWLVAYWMFERLLFGVT